MIILEGNMLEGNIIRDMCLQFMEINLDGLEKFGNLNMNIKITLIKSEINRIIF